MSKRERNTNRKAFKAEQEKRAAEYRELKREQEQQQEQEETDTTADREGIIYTPNPLTKLIRVEEEHGHRADKDIPDQIVARNVPRRHLTTKQRAAIAAELANMREGGDKRSDHCLKKSSDLISQTQAAKMLNVSRSSVQAAKREKRKAEGAAPAKQRKGKKSLQPFDTQVHAKWSRFLKGFGMEQERQREVARVVHSFVALMLKDWPWAQSKGEIDIIRSFMAFLFRNWPHGKQSKEALEHLHDYAALKEGAN
jgi:hypothetical protein